MHHSMTFALPAGYDWDIKVFTREVKTKKWAKQHQVHLEGYACRFTTEGNDDAITVKSMLECGYGYNIGGQIFDKLTPNDVAKIRANVISL